MKSCFNQQARLQWARVSKKIFLKLKTMFASSNGVCSLSEMTSRGMSAESFIVDSTVFDVFSFKLLKGDKKTALREPFSIVLTETMAKKYFGNEDPVGQSLKMDYDNYKVTGVMEDVPENSHFRFSNLISFSTWSRNNKDNEDRAWFWNGFHTYVLLRDAQSVENVRSKMKDFLTRNVEKGGMYYDDLPLQPLASIYMAAPRSWENGSPRQHEQRLHPFDHCGVHSSDRVFQLY
jgi:hypothetical protein